MFEKQGLLVKDGNRLKYISAEGEEHKEYRKNWTGELLDMVMKDYQNKASVVNTEDEDEVESNQIEEPVTNG